MFCKCCGKDLVGTRVCLYCGWKQDLSIDAREEIDASKYPTETNASSSDFSSFSAVSDPFTEQSSKLGANPEQRRPTTADVWLAHKDSLPEKGKKISNIIIIAMLVGLLLSALLLAVFAENDELIIKAEEWLTNVGIDVDGFNDIDTVFITLWGFFKLFIPLFIFAFVLGQLRSLCDISSVLILGRSIQKSGINGIELLSQHQGTDRAQILETSLISRALCSKDDPSYSKLLVIQLIANAALQAIELILTYLFFDSFVIILSTTVSEMPYSGFEDIFQQILGSTLQDYLTMSYIICSLLVVIPRLIIGGKLNKKYKEWANSQSQGSIKY